MVFGEEAEIHAKTWSGALLHLNPVSLLCIFTKKIDL